jgi:hypothetical protein
MTITQDQDGHTCDASYGRMRPGSSRAIRARQLHEVGIMQLGAIDTPLKSVALVPHDDAEGVVIKNDDHRVDYAPGAAESGLAFVCGPERCTA